MVHFTIVMMCTYISGCIGSVGRQQVVRRIASLGPGSCVLDPGEGELLAVWPLKSMVITPHLPVNLSLSRRYINSVTKFFTPIH